MKFWNWLQSHPILASTTSQLSEWSRATTHNCKQHWGYFPKANLTNWVEGDGDGLLGLIKGKYFEVLVKDRLNNERVLGELRLEPGQRAELAKSPNQPGWDLKIVNQRGETVEQIQLKATESMSYVRDALEKYPDFRVAVPEELDSTSYEILGTGISESELEEATEEHIAELSEGVIANAFQTTAEFGVDVIPLGSMLFIGIIEGRRYLMGAATLRESMRRGGKRLGRTSAYSGIGTALAATGLGLAAIPVVMGLRVAENRVAARINLGDNLASRTAELLRLPTDT